MKGTRSNGAGFFCVCSSDISCRNKNIVFGISARETVKKKPQQRVARAFVFLMDWDLFIAFHFLFQFSQGVQISEC
jgi:hypothetical protein